MCKNFLKGPTFRRHQDVKKITKSIRELLDLGYVSYQRVDVHGRYQCLGDRPDWVESYIDRQLYVRDIFLRHPRFFCRGKRLLSNYGLPSISLPFLSEFGIGDTLLFFDRDVDSMELVGFSEQLGAGVSVSDFLNEEGLLQQFLDYFKKESRKLLASSPAIDLRALRGQDFELGPSFSPVLDPARRVRFLAAIDPTFPFSEVERLTARERQCLEGLAEGLSLPALAARLALSPRTVEHYLENAKDKLGLFTRQELCSLARRLQQVEFLHSFC